RRDKVNDAPDLPPEDQGRSLGGDPPLQRGHDLRREYPPLRRGTLRYLGLDHCEARSWHGWHRHMSLCLAAAAFLARLAANLRRATWGKANERSPAVPAAA